MAEFLDEDQAAQALTAAKRINQDIIRRKRKGYQEFTADVLSEEVEYEMSLKGVVTEATGYLKLNLFVGAQAVAMLHRGKVHHNPGCERLAAPVHKHRWSDADREKGAYVPADVDPSSCESTFRSFLKECNIEFSGHFALPALQRRLL
jgi:hypothetical protein